MPVARDAMRIQHVRAGSADEGIGIVHLRTDGAGGKRRRRRRSIGFRGDLGGAPLRGEELREKTDGSLAEPFNSKTRPETLAYHKRGSSKLIAPYPSRYRLVLRVH